MATGKTLLRISRFLWVLPIILLTSCCCYKFGSPGLASLPFQTLYVKPVANKTYVPQAQALLSEQLIRYLQQSGVEITQDEEFADATLSIVISSYTQTAFTTRSHNTELANSFVLTLEASCTLIDNNSCKPYFANNKVSTTINAEAEESIFQRVVYQDMPVLTQKLANKIRDLVVSTW